MITTTPIPRADPALDWVSQHDSRSLAFPYTAEPVEEKARSWDTGLVLDQGREGACVGFGWTGELLASPRPYRLLDARDGDRYASGVYHRALQIDEYEGEADEGTSVLAGAKVMVERGHITGYRWCFGIEDVRAAVINEGPVVIGIPWYDRMYSTRPSGLVEVGGSLVGGHCILLTGYHPGMRITGEGWLARHRVFRWCNSWGPTYGIGGNGYVRYDDLADLLAHWGEACVPTGRRQVRL